MISIKATKNDLHVIYLDCQKDDKIAWILLQIKNYAQRDIKYHI